MLKQAQHDPVEDKIAEPETRLPHQPSCVKHAIER